MKTKNRSYFLLSSIFIISGCGSSSTSDNTTPNSSIQEAVSMTLDLNSSDTTYKMNTITSGSRNTYKVTSDTILEDAEDGTTDGWRSYDSTPSPILISNIYDNSKKSKVINLQGVRLDNGAYFSLGNNASDKTIKWSMNFNNNYTIYIRLNTKNGDRYIYYTPANYNYGKAPAPYDFYIHHGLGSDSKDGTWKTFSRDLTQDLQEFEPNNSVNSIVGLYVRGSGRIDDISLLKTSIDSECIGYHDLKNKINNNQDVTHANISCIRDMSGLFSNNKTFNQNISSWETSHVTSMAWMFNGASTFNQDISSWETSKVTTMKGMFNHAYKFNQNINTWDTSHVTNMDYTFTHAEAFDQDLSLWQVNKVKSHEAFAYAAADGIIEPDWEGTNNNPCITETELRFKIRDNKDVTNVNTGCITDMSHLFSENHNFNQDISKWDTSNVTNMRFMFESVYSFNQDISKWNTSNVTDMSFMFAGMEGERYSNPVMSFNQDISSWDVSKVTDMSLMFRNSDFNQNLKSWNVSNVTNMDSMFNGAESFSQDLSSWNVDNVQTHKDFSKDTGGVIEPNWKRKSNIIDAIQQTWLNEKGISLTLTQDDVLFVNNSTRLVKVSNVSTAQYTNYSLDFIEYAIFDISTIDTPKILKTIRFEEYHDGMDIEIPIVKLLKNGIVRFNTGRNVYVYDLNTNKVLLDFLRLSSPTHYSFIETKDNKKIYFVRYESMEAPRLYLFNLDTLQLKASKDIGYYVPNNPKLSDDETKLIVENIIDKEIELNLNELLTENEQARYFFPK